MGDLFAATCGASEQLAPGAVLLRGFAAPIDAALEHRDEALDYALGFGRGLDDARGDEFVGMYVNELTQDFGAEGRAAVRELLRRAEDVGAYEAGVRVEFLE